MRIRMSHLRPQSTWSGGLAVILSFAALGSCAKPSPKSALRLDAPTSSATWPWPNAKEEELHRGVSRWRSQADDGTELELIEFDFARNPKLRFEIYDQDEDDAKPFDNQADYFPNGVGQVTKHLNGIGRGPVIAAWNGLFFAYDRSQNPPHGIATHIGPNVLAGKVRHNVGNHRWTFGVKQVKGRPRFEALHLPDKTTLAQEFDYASVGAQLLVREGKPLRIQPYPQPNDPPLPQPVPSTPEEAGHIPLVDHMRTSRTSMGWSKDSGKLWLLVVNEPDHELGSKLAVKRGELGTGGWMLADLQRFWLSFGAWGAVNSDGGARRRRARSAGDRRASSLRFRVRPA
ncbi:hypothetical protein EON81_19225 [bacterium]|nr:MAG: hypothetical protein EON81_19225 [bacterium]